MAHWVRELGFQRWMLAVGLSLFFLFVLLGLRRFAWRKLTRWAKASMSSLGDALLEELNLPVIALLVVASIGIGLQAAPELIRNHPLTVYGTKLSFIGIGVWALERVITAVFRSQSLPPALTGSTRILLLTVFRLLFLSFGLLAILDTVGISITPILASLGVGSVAVALALQDTLGNFFSGLYLLIDKPIRIGDFVKVDEGIEGYVTRIGWRSTHVQMLSNNVVVLPNSKIASSQLTNFDLPDKETAVLVEVGVSYDSDLEQVERVTNRVSKEVLTRVTGAVVGFEPFIRFHTLGDSSIGFTVILRAKQFTDRYLLKHEFTKALHATYRQEGISIPFPQRVVHLKKDA